MRGGGALLLLLLVLGRTASQCTGPPAWAPQWAMRASLYSYCFGSCPLPYLALPNVTAIGRFSGVVGFDHLFTHQGLPCIDGVPREFDAQDAVAVATKRTFPGSRVLQYVRGGRKARSPPPPPTPPRTSSRSLVQRILDAVPYAAIVHDLLSAHPEYFVRWTHAPTDNGTVCEMPPEEGTTGAAGANCSWPIRAAAYDWTQPAVVEWFVENIIAPTLRVADGAWLDGDGPGNGAWACSGTYNRANLPAPYPALNVSETAAFVAGAARAAAAAQAHLIAHGGYEYGCMDFVQDTKSLPNATDSPAVCAAKLQALDHLAPQGHHVAKSSIVLYSSRTASSGYDDAHAAQAVAVFMLVRDSHWWLGLPASNAFSADATRALLEVDYGPPVGNMTRTTGAVFSRTFARGVVALDCDSFTATFTPSPATSGARAM